MFLVGIEFDSLKIFELLVCFSYRLTTLKWIAVLGMDETREGDILATTRSH
jgi:hypothetical protein